MKLRSFGYQQVLTPEMMSVLFKDLSNYRGDFNYGYELINAAINNRIDISKNFNLFGWCKAVKDGNMLEKNRELKYRMSIISDTDEYEQSGVTEANLVDDKNYYALIEDAEEVAKVVNKIKKINNDIMIVTGLDLVYCINKAIKGVPAAVEELTKFCKDYEWYAEDIRIILMSGIPFNELFKDMLENDNTICA